MTVFLRRELAAVSESRTFRELGWISLRTLRDAEPWSFFADMISKRGESV